MNNSICKDLEPMIATTFFSSFKQLFITSKRLLLTFIVSNLQNLIGGFQSFLRKNDVVLKTNYYYDGLIVFINIKVVKTC